MVSAPSLACTSPMTLPNRIDPWGQFVATPEHGTRMGNRGILHDAQGALRRHWAHKAWVCCALAFKGRQRARPWSTTGTYSELFFMDEATALAAGHRPCAECQRARFLTFKAAWAAAHGGGAGLRAADIDTQLHIERAAARGTKPVFRAPLAELPTGCLFAISSYNDAGIATQGGCESGSAKALAKPGDPVFLRTPRGDLPWTAAGYGPPAAPREEGTWVTVLTPPSVVAVLRHGYVPQLHPSAGDEAG